MGFLRYTLHLIDFLAWPVLALGYPLFASIRAIETGSKYHMRKLVTYWTIFSFISLFEHVFEKLIEWVPLWPYIKLITICWLVIPPFNGACYLYQNLIRPCFPLKLHDSIRQFSDPCYVYQRLLYLCLSVNLQTVTDWFNKPMEDPYLKNETFLAVAERYLEENGSDALEKLIADKDYSSNHHAEEIKPTDTSDEAGKLSLNQGYPIQIEKKTTGVQVKEMVVPADAEEIKLPEITSSKQVQTEWTCAVCQVITSSEQNLKSHLNGMKHKARCAGLKTCKQTAKSEGSSPVTTKSNQLNQEKVKHEAAARSEHIANEAAEPKQVKILKETPIQIEKKTTAVQIKETALPADAEEIKLPETNSVKKVQTEWTTTKSEHDLECHLLGRRDEENCEVLKTFKKTAKTERNPSFPPNMPDKLKEQVKHAISTKRKHSTNEKPKEKVQLGATGQHQKQKQVKKAGGAAHNSKLWCRFCNIRCPGEIDMASHLNGRKHLAKLQETMSFTGGTWASDYANMQFYQGI
ncbi:uncharacterized protein LOC132606439 isoform X2 [Lycium barbarum]|uniref:uncharacterized protein LOC132606439 isoform X2 n=1 Tax=Lycium barbarum TaxID=112863 RepID=UPI00293E6B18|nr:uncharacterized protein LOC132606439 isoform X2 [Lycium barbarum]